MPSSKATWIKSTLLVGTAFVAGSTLSDLGVVSFITGNTYQSGTSEITTASGATVTAGGGRFQATNLADAACRKDPTTGRYYSCHQEVLFTNSGACVAAGCTGAGKSYHVAEITKPFTNSGTLQRVAVNCDQPGQTSTMYAAQVAAASTISGTNIFSKKTIGTGANAISSTGSQVWGKTTTKIRVFLGSRIGTGNANCVLSVDSEEAFNP